MISAFLKLIRLKNLLIIALTQIVIKYFLIEAYIAEPSLTYFSFSLYLIALILIVASGYIINDIYDVQTDKINKKQIIGKSINSRSAIAWYIFLNLIGLSLGCYIAYLVRKPSFSLIFIYCIFFS